MKFCLVLVTVAVLVDSIVSTGYGSGGGGSGYGGGSGASSYGGGGAGREAPKPYAFDYNAADGEGNSHYRNEQGDQSGKVKGTYGYSDAQGLYRVVEYVADEGGFRASIRTNEPGVDGKESPADVSLTAEQPPAGLQGGASSYGSRTGGGSAPKSYGGGGGKSGY